MALRDFHGLIQLAFAKAHEQYSTLRLIRHDLAAIPDRLDRRREDLRPTGPGRLSLEPASPASGRLRADQSLAFLQPGPERRRGIRSERNAHGQRLSTFDGRRLSRLCVGPYLGLALRRRQAGAVPP